MAWVYVIKNKNGQFYIGSTNDMERRFKQHLHGNTKTTHRLIAETIALKQKYNTLKEARSVENKIKNLKRRDYIEKMIEEGYIRIEP